MYKILGVLVLVLCLSCVTACSRENISNHKNNLTTQMPNPWSDCNQDFAAAAEIAGFSFKIVLPQYTVRAMKDMIEINYPLDESRELTLRKSSSEANNCDLSGDYNVYKIDEKITLDNGVVVNVRRDETLIYVMFFGAEQGYYSVSCDKGLTINEIKKAYDLIANAEAPVLPPEADN